MSVSVSETAVKSPAESAGYFRRSEEELKNCDLTVYEVWNTKPKYYKVLKRAFDIVASGAAMLLLLPVFLGTVCAILIEDGRPVFFAQMRSGKDMRPFRMYKFRSMKKDASRTRAALLARNEQSGPAFKIRRDPRITRVGGFIRPYGIRSSTVIECVRGLSIEAWGAGDMAWSREKLGYVRLPNLEARR